MNKHHKPSILSEFSSRGSKIPTSKSSIKKEYESENEDMSSEEEEDYDISIRESKGSSLRKKATAIPKRLQDIPLFDPYEVLLKPPWTMLAIGNQRAGKTHMLKHLMYILAKSQAFDYILCFSATKANGFLESFLPDNSVHGSFSIDMLSDFMAKVSEAYEKGHRNQVLIIFDDILGMVKFNTPLMKNIITSARNIDVSVYATTQALMQVPDYLRQNATVTQVYYIDHQDNREWIWKNLLGGHRDHLGHFMDLLEEVGENHQCLIISRFGTGVKMMDRLKRYQAPEKIPNFKIQQKFRGK